MSELDNEGITIHMDQSEVDKLSALREMRAGEILAITKELLKRWKGHIELEREVTGYGTIAWNIKTDLTLGDVRLKITIHEDTDRVALLALNTVLRDLLDEPET